MENSAYIKDGKRNNIKLIGNNIINLLISMIFMESKNIDQFNFLNIR